MSTSLTQSDFRERMKTYLDEVANNETVFVTRTHNRTVAVIFTTTRGSAKKLENGKKQKDKYYTDFFVMS